MNGAFKGLNQADVYSTSYISKKQWQATSESFENLGIDKKELISGSSTYDSFRISYYEGSIPASGSFTGSYDLNLQSTLTLQGGRRLPETIVAYSIPRSCFGEAIEQNSFSLVGDGFSVWDREGLLILDKATKTAAKELTLEQGEINQTSVSRVLDQFSVIIGQEYNLSIKVLEDSSWEDLEDINCFILDGIEGGTETLTGRDLDNYKGSSLSIDFIAERPQIDFTWIENESREGTQLFFEITKKVSETDTVVGDIIYNRGLVLLHGNKVNPGSCELAWTSIVTINTWNINCKVKDLEYNKTYNPSAKSLENYTPYITAIGLYNRFGELMAIAKLSKPIRKNNNIDMAFKVNLDIS